MWAGLGDKYARVLDRHPSLAATADFVTRVVQLVIVRRLTGLSAESAFWLVFSLPWLLIGSLQVLGLVYRAFPGGSLAEFEQQVLTWTDENLSPELREDYVQPLLSDMFAQASTGISVVSLVVALWAGSRSIQTFIEANMIINGQFRTRGYLKVRLMSIGLLLAIVAAVAVAVPVASFGPDRVAQAIGMPAWLVSTVAFVVAGLVLVVVLVAALHYSLSERPSLLSSVPGAVLIAVGWFAGSQVLGFYVQRLFDDASVYSVLAAPIAILVYAFALSYVAFFGSAVNAALRGVRPDPSDPVH